ncbi:MAG TPA: HAD family phosphatase [Rhizobacter sp.]|nr:HAD family phosphatase [Rhizobacter sp.]
MNLIFDLGGVVFRWRPAVLMREVLPQRAIDAASAHALAEQFFQGYGGDWGEFDRGTIEVADLAERIALRCGLSLGEVRAVIDAIPAELAPLSDTVELLGRLRDRGDPLFYLSNMPAIYADHLERNAFFTWFRDGVFSSRVRLVKPEPAIFQVAAQRFGIDPGQSVFIDDVAKNITAAVAQGWHALQFHDAAQCEAELLERGWI